MLLVHPTPALHEPLYKHTEPVHTGGILITIVLCTSLFDYQHNSTTTSLSNTCIAIAITITTITALTDFTSASSMTELKQRMSQIDPIAENMAPEEE